MPHFSLGVSTPKVWPLGLGGGNLRSSSFQNDHLQDWVVGFCFFFFNLNCSVQLGEKDERDCSQGKVLCFMKSIAAFLKRQGI